MNRPIAVLPVSRPDFHLAIKWIQWSIALRKFSPAVAPHQLMVVPAASLLLAEIQRLCDECSGHDIIVHAQRELYERPEFGYGAAANGLFKSALEIVEEVFPGCPMLWVEADTVPTRPTWFNEIADEYANCGRPFLGAFHPNGLIPHMSGNAVYPANWRVLAPSLAALPGPNPAQGWDTSCAHEIIPQMAISKTIQQEWITPPFSEDNINRFLKPETALFHRSKDGTMIDVLAKRMRIRAIPLIDPVAPPTSIITLGRPHTHREPTVSILIVTHAKDIPFLRYCLKSIKLYTSGFKETVLLVPEHQRGEFDWVRQTGVVVKSYDEPAEKGFLSHLIQKCRADEWCLDADFVLHIDADCMLFRKTTPAAFIRDHRCISVRESYSGITNPHRHTWRETVRKAIGIEPAHDYMLKHGQIHPRSVYRATRELVESHTGRLFDEYVLDGRNNFPQSFAEFPTIGTVGRHLFSCCYEYIEYDKAADVALCGQHGDSFQYVYKRGFDHLVEFWGHGGIDRYKADCEAILAGRIPEYWIK